MRKSFEGDASSRSGWIYSNRKTRTGVRPLYVSVGHRATLADSVRWTLRACRGVRLPEPTRRAHQAVTELKRRGAVRA